MKVFVINGSPKGSKTVLAAFPVGIRRLGPAVYRMICVR